MTYIEKVLYIHLIVYMENKTMSTIFFLICTNYSTASYVMFDKLFALLVLIYLL